MNWKSLLFAVALLVLVAGCAAPKAPGSTAPTSTGTPATSEPAPQERQFGPVGIAWVDVPAEVLIGKPIDLKWSVSGSGSATTAVFYSTKSRADVEEPTMMTYQSMSPRVTLTGDLPGDFTTSISFDEPIKVYVRAYATVDGKTYWTDEKVVQIVVTMSSATTSSEDAGTTY